MEAVSCMFLLPLWEGHGPYYGRPAGITFQWCFPMPNISTSMGLKSFCPLSLKLGRNTETTAIHPWEVHYRMAIVCNICCAFAAMSILSIVDHHSGCQAKCNKECVKGLQKPLQKRKSLQDKRRHPLTTAQMLPRSHDEWNATLHFLSIQASEHKSVHSLNHSRSLQIHFEASLHSVRWTVIPFVVQWSLCQTIIYHFIFCLSFYSILNLYFNSNILTLWTHNKL